MKKILFIFILIFMLFPVNVIASTATKNIIYNGNQSIMSYVIDEDIYVRAEDMAYLLRNSDINYDIKDNRLILGDNYSNAYTYFTGKNSYNDASPTTLSLTYQGYKLNLNGYTINNSTFVKLNDLARAVGFNSTWKKAKGMLTLSKEYNGLIPLENQGLSNILYSDYYSTVLGFCYSGFLNNNIRAVSRTTEIAMELAPIGYSLNKSSVLQSTLNLTITPCSDKYDPDKPMVALTFDDGPKGENTLRILNALAKVDGRATFFMVGTNVAKYPEVVEKINDLGCETANHTYSHPQLTKLSLSDAMKQINDVQQKIYSITGKYPRSGRPPYGAINSEIGNASGLNWYNWSIDTLDWKYKNPDRVYNAVINNVEDGDVILMHDIHATTIDAVERIVPKLHEMGYQLVTISELTEAKGKENVPGYIKLE